jgi:hypothetical protein
MNGATSALIAACAALLAASITYGGVLTGARLNKIRERQNWLRDQRLRYSVDFITSTRQLLNEYRRHGEEGMDQTERSELRGRMRYARSAIELLYPSEAIAAVRKINDGLYDTRPGETKEKRKATEEAFQMAVSALRGGLDVPPSARSPDGGR